MLIMTLNNIEYERRPQNHKMRLLLQIIFPLASPKWRNQKTLRKKKTQNSIGWKHTFALSTSSLRHRKFVHVVHTNCIYHQPKTRTKDWRSGEHNQIVVQRKIVDRTNVMFSMCAHVNIYNWVNKCKESAQSLLDCVYNVRCTIWCFP